MAMRVIPASVAYPHLASGSAGLHSAACAAWAVIAIMAAVSSIKVLAMSVLSIHRKLPLVSLTDFAQRSTVNNV